uniref:Uncharacterized protein n=1 Tax=Setaria italica TaxID=4555 RepID=K4AN87_SETIT
MRQLRRRWLWGTGRRRGDRGEQERRRLVAPSREQRRRRRRPLLPLGERGHGGRGRTTRRQRARRRGPQGGGGQAAGGRPQVLGGVPGVGLPLRLGSRPDQWPRQSAGLSKFGLGTSLQVTATVACVFGVSKIHSSKKMQVCSCSNRPSSLVILSFRKSCALCIYFLHFTLGYFFSSWCKTGAKKK